MSGARFSEWLYRKLAVFERPRPRLWILGAALLLAAPSLWSGLSLDDYILLYYRRPDAVGGMSRSPFDLFVFAASRWLIDGFGLPWWSLEHGRGQFMRPVSSLTHALDAWLWPQHPALMHLHSLAWLGLAILLAQRLYARLEAPWIAGVAGAFFALEDSHGLPVGWISNRNALIGAVFGFAALIAHHRHRTESKLVFAAFGWLCFVLGLLSAELAVGTAAYVLAYAVFLDRAPWPRRVLAVLPYVVIFGVWSYLYSALGYGTYGLGSYLDPVRSTAEFLRALPARWALLLSSQAGGVPTDFWIFFTGERRVWLIAAAVLVLVLAIWFVLPSLHARSTARFWACGAVLSALPATATTPNDRLLVFVGLGGLALLAHAVHDSLVKVRSAWPERRRGRAFAAGGFAFFHFALGAFFLPIRSLEAQIPAKVAEQADSTVPKEASITEKTVIVPHASASLVVSYLPVMRLFRGENLPRRIYWLTATPSIVHIERRAPNVLRVRPEAGFYAEELEQHYRSLKFPFHVGERVVLSDMTVEIIALTRDNRPAVCDFTFREPLESPRYVWLTWKHAIGFVPFELPRVGRSIASDIYASAPSGERVTRLSEREP